MSHKTVLALCSQQRFLKKLLTLTRAYHVSASAVSTLLVISSSKQHYEIDLINPTSQMKALKSTRTCPRPHNWFCGDTTPSPCGARTVCPVHLSLPSTWLCLPRGELAKNSLDEPAPAQGILHLSYLTHRAQRILREISSVICQFTEHLTVFPVATLNFSITQAITLQCSRGH